MNQRERYRVVEIGLITHSTYTHPLITNPTMKKCISTHGSKKDQKNLKNSQKLKFGLWNVRGCSQESKLHQIASQITERQYHLAVITETRMPSKILEMDEHTTLLNCNPDTSDYKNTGVAFIVNNHTNITTSHFNEINSRIATIIVHSKSMNQSFNVIGCYSPTEASDDDNQKDNFYLSLKQTIMNIKQNKLPIILMGDFNCRLSQELHTMYPHIIGKAIKLEKDTSPNGIRLINLCQSTKLKIMNTFIQKSHNKSITWMHPNTNDAHTIDLILSDNKPNSNITICDVHNSRSMEANSDHFMLTTIIKLQLKKSKKKHKHTHKTCTQNNSRNAIHSLSSEYPTILTNLINETNDLTQIEKSIICAATLAANPRKSTIKRWQTQISEDLKEELKHRKQLRLQWLNNPTTENRDKYNQANKQVKHKIKTTKEE
ncbi:unnamed protein product [Schistosoma bovis]|nr:unnamed protein product [Schistosoma bovis]